MRLCTVYRSPRRDQMYLYVDRREGLSRVPAALLENFGDAEEVLSLPLTPDRALSRADAAVVLEQIEAQGFYLQMPPPGGDLPELAGQS